MEMVEMSVETALLRLLPQLASNRRHALDEIRAWRLKGCQEKTIYKHFICLLPFMRLYADKDWLRLGRREIEDYMLWLRKKAPAIRTLHKGGYEEVCQKVLFRLREVGARGVDRLHRKSKGIPRECLLTPEEVRKPDCQCQRQERQGHNSRFLRCWPKAWRAREHKDRMSRIDS